MMLSDIFPTGWDATELAGVLPGESVVVQGGGPVGLMAAHSALIKGAAKVVLIDFHDDRAQARRAARGDRDRPAQGRRRRAGARANPRRGRRSQLRGRRLPVPRPPRRRGPEPHHEPARRRGATDRRHRRRRRLPARGPRCAGRPGQGGQARVRLLPVLVQGPVHQDRPGERQAVQSAPARPHRSRPAKPSQIVSHELSLDEAPDAYKAFDERQDGWTKVVLHPAA